MHGSEASSMSPRIDKLFFQSATTLLYTAVVAFHIAVDSGLCLKTSSETEVISIQNGTWESSEQSVLVLDCPYELETEEDSVGLVVKWYLDDRPRPVYQWIPNHEPQELGILRDRLDLTHEISQDESKKHRALAIFDPTPELSGNYSCWVSNFQQEKVHQVIFTIYNPAEFVNISIERSNDSMTVFCLGEGLFPEPHLELFWKHYYGSKKIEETDMIVNFDNEKGLYDVYLEQTFDHEDLEWENTFRCVVSIPHTEYSEEDKLVYYPNPTTTSTTTTTTTTTPAPTSIVFLTQVPNPDPTESMIEFDDSLSPPLLPSSTALQDSSVISETSNDIHHLTSTVSSDKAEGVNLARIGSSSSQKSGALLSIFSVFVAVLMLGRSQ